MHKKTKTGIASLGSLLMIAASSAAGFAQSTTAAATTFCCATYNEGIDVGQSCTVTTYSPYAVNQCANVSFSCGFGAFVTCTPSASSTKRQPLVDCSCFSFTSIDE